MAYLIEAIGQDVANILLASVLIGTAFAFLHSTMQTWATEVGRGSGHGDLVLRHRSVHGAAVGTAAVSGLAGGHRYGALFLVAAAATVPVVAIAAIARALFTSAPASPATIAKATI